MLKVFFVSLLLAGIVICCAGQSGSPGSKEIHKLYISDQTDRGSVLMARSQRIYRQNR